MKRAFFAGIALCLTATTALAAPEGIYKTAETDGIYLLVDIAPCGPALCGKIIEESKGDSGIVGMEMFVDMIDDGSGTYKGRIVHPETGKKWRGKVRETSDTVLNVKGCLGPICLGEDWVKQ